MVFLVVLISVSIVKKVTARSNEKKQCVACCMGVFVSYNEGEKEKRSRFIPIKKVPLCNNCF